MQDTDNRFSANPSYVLGQLARAFTTSHEHRDPATRSRALDKIRRWGQVFQGMVSGALDIGSRNPAGDIPVWVTLDVMQGGFASGDLPAGGPLLPHERELLTRTTGNTEGESRFALNRYYLTDEGFAELRQMLHSGCYRINLPEEGALLVVAWLLEHGQDDRARILVDEIGGFGDRLRFYPVPAGRALNETSLVFLRTVGQTIHQLEMIEVPTHVARNRESVEKFLPLYDRVVSLFLETVEGEPPSLDTNADGKPLRSSDGRHTVRGGWPCVEYPGDWRDRAVALVSEVKAMQAAPSANGTLLGAGRPNFMRLVDYLKRCTDDPTRLSGRDVGMIRYILASIITKRDTPGSEQWQQLRKFQHELATRPATPEFAKVMIRRLSALPQDEGVASRNHESSTVTAQEARDFGIEPGAQVPDSLIRKVRRSRSATVEELVADGIIPSAEVLAQVVPQITGQVRAEGISDPSLARLYHALYTAFRRRRSLLLLNLESQVKLEELPWIRAIEDQRIVTAAGTSDSLRTLARIIELAIIGFPHQILPNKLLQEIRALITGAGLKLPIVDELAADIFMGQFARKYRAAARIAATLLTGTLYQRYYAIAFEQVEVIHVLELPESEAHTSAGFALLCYQRAGESPGGNGWSVAANGKVIEQGQILTTHNLATLYGVPGVATALQPRLADLARACFEWICRRMQLPVADPHTELVTIKNCAYAWRQMIFFLSVAPEPMLPEFITWAQGHLASQQPEFIIRFQPALDGLVQASSVTDTTQHIQQFVGWTTERHWLMRSKAG